jgi:peroxiredoxin
MPVAVGDKAPFFELPAGDGSTRTLSDLTAAGPALLAFFKMSCPVCKMSFPVFGEMGRRYGDVLPVVAVSQDPVDQARPWLDERGFDAPVLDDARGNYAVSAAYELDTVPTLVLVGDGGEVLEVLQGWDREKVNGLAARLGDLTGRDGGPVSTPEDGLRPFRPG